jgi:hypothetical protein
MAREIAFIPDPGASATPVPAVSGPKGDTGEGWKPGSVPTFIQATEPEGNGPFWWIDTSTPRHIWKFKDPDGMVSQIETQPAWLEPAEWADGAEPMDLRKYGTMRLQVSGLTGGDTITVSLALEEDGAAVALKGVSNQLSPVSAIIASGIYTFGAGGFATWAKTGNASNPTIVVGAGA